MICKDFNRKDFSQHNANTRKVRKLITSLTMKFLNLYRENTSTKPREQHAMNKVL